MSQTKDKPIKVRKNFKFPSELIAWAEIFAAKKNTNLTQLLVDYLTDLRERNNP